MNVTFKLADPDSMRELIPLMKEFYLVEHLSFNEEIITKSLIQLFNNKNLGFISLLLHEKKMIGYFVLTFGFSMEFHGRDALVDEFYIKEEYRGKGFGKQALNFIEVLCRNKGIRAVHLEVDRSNFRAQEIYRKAGYKDHNRYLLTKWLD